jgi:hypothetical protein
MQNRMRRNVPTGEEKYNCKPVTVEVLSGGCATGLVFNMM